MQQHLSPAADVAAFLDDIERAEQEATCGLVLYHGTSRSRLPGILARGLDPSLVPDDMEEDERLNADPGDPGPFRFVFLSDSEWWAREWAEENHGDPVVLEVTLPPHLAAQVRTDLGEFHRAPFLVPPACIRVLGLAVVD